MPETINQLFERVQRRQPQRAESSRVFMDICPLFPAIKSKILYAARNWRSLRSLSQEYGRKTVDRAIQEGYIECWRENIRLRGQLLAGAMTGAAA